VTYDHTTGAVAFTDLVTTKRACADPAVAALEAGVLAGLRAAEAASVDEVGRLVLAGAGPTILLTVGPEPGAPPIDRQPAPS
jgi:heat shock protein HslJ